MKPDNYMSFSVVAGFFIGLAFAITKFDEPGIYGAMDDYYNNGRIFDCGGVRGIVFWFLDFENTKLKKSKLESNLEYYRLEFDKREKESAKIRNFIKSIESDDEEMAAQQNAN